MAGKRARHKRSSCKRKTPYTAYYAIDQAAMQSIHQGIQFGVYKCDYCQFFHITSHPNESHSNKRILTELIYKVPQELYLIEEQ